VPITKVRPDFLLTHVRDASASTVGAAVVVEVKLPGCIGDAVVQLCAYLRRRVYKLCCERYARGEPFNDIFALGAATDGCSVVLVRMLSGAPMPGASFDGAKPCPSIATAPLPLLDEWDFCARCLRAWRLLLTSADWMLRWERVRRSRFCTPTYHGRQAALAARTDRPRDASLLNSRLVRASAAAGQATPMSWRKMMSALS